MIKLLAIIGSTSLISTPIININNNYLNITEKEINSELNINKNLSQQERIISESNSDKIDIFGSGGGTVGHEATESEIKNFSNLVPNYQWFTKLNLAESFGYIDLSSKIQGADGKAKGLCEYISLSTILTYLELFVSAGFFNDTEWEEYFKPRTYTNKVAIPIHKYFQDNQSTSSLVYKLYQINKKTDLWWGSDVVSTFLKFLDNKPIKSQVEVDYCASTMHSSSPEKYLLQNNLPVMVSFTKKGGHNVVIYGYDTKTKSYLVHYGWPREYGWPKYSRWIIPKSQIWSFWSTGFWNAFYFKSSASKNPTRKAFKYNNQEYSWNQLKNIGLTWNQVVSE